MRTDKSGKSHGLGLCEVNVRRLFVRDRNRDFIFVRSSVDRGVCELIDG